MAAHDDLKVLFTINRKHNYALGMPIDCVWASISAWYVYVGCGLLGSHCDRNRNAVGVEF
jgi:hypothetical protein